MRAFWEELHLLPEDMARNASDRTGVSDRLCVGMDVGATGSVGPRRAIDDSVERPSALRSDLQERRGPALDLNLPQAMQKRSRTRRVLLDWPMSAGTPSRPI